MASRWVYVWSLDVNNRSHWIYYRKCHSGIYTILIYPLSLLTFTFEDFLNYLLDGTMLIYFFVAESVQKFCICESVHTCTYIRMHTHTHTDTHIHMRVWPVLHALHLGQHGDRVCCYSSQWSALGPRLWHRGLPLSRGVSCVDGRP